MRYPDRLQTLILLGPAPPRAELLQVFAENLRRNTLPEDSALLASIQTSDAFAAREPQTFQEYYRVLMRGYVYDRRFADSIDMTLGRRTAQNLDAVNTRLLQDLGDWDIRNRLSVIDCPTLIVHGIADPLPVAGSAEIHDAIAGSRLVVLERAGHWLHVEAKERLFGLIRRFLADPESIRSEVPAEVSR